MLEKTEPVPFLKIVDNPARTVPAVDFARSSLPGERPTPFQRGELYLNTHFEGHSAADVLARVRSPQEYASDDPIFKVMVDYPFSRGLLAKVLEAQMAINEGDPSRPISEKELEVEEDSSEASAAEPVVAPEPHDDPIVLKGTDSQYERLRKRYTLPGTIHSWKKNKEVPNVAFLVDGKPVRVGEKYTLMETYDEAGVRLIRTFKKDHFGILLHRLTTYDDEPTLYERQVSFDNQLPVLNDDIVSFKERYYRFNDSTNSITPLSPEETQDFIGKMKVARQAKLKRLENARRTASPTEPVVSPVIPPEAPIETPVVAETAPASTVESDEVALSNGDEVAAEVPAGNDTAALPTQAVTSSEIPEQKTDSNELLDLEDDDAEEGKWEDFRGIRRAKRRDGSKGRRNGKLRDSLESEEPVVESGQVVAERPTDSSSATAPELVEDSINLPGVTLSNQNGEQRSVSLTNTDPEKPISVITMYGDGPTDHTIRTSDRITPVLNLDYEFPTYVEVDGTYYKLASDGNGFVTLTPREAQQLEAKILT